MKANLALPVFIAAVFSATIAEACSWAEYNVYERDAAHRIASAYDRAATIDWIEIEEPGPASCPRMVIGDDQPVTSGIPEACSDAQDPGYVSSTAPGAYRLFTAKVLERLKGTSPDRYSLGHDWPSNLGGPAGYFSDLRVSPAVVHYIVALAEKVRADSRHHGLGFWDHGRLGPIDDLRTTCGGGPTLEPRMRYAAFRDAEGRTIALEPVLYGDDRLLSALRTAKQGRDLAPEIGVEAYFRASEKLILVRLVRCRFGGEATERVWAKVVRGDPDQFPRIETDYSGETTVDIRKPGIDVDFLEDWLQARGDKCKNGQLVLIAQPAFTAPVVQLDKDWALQSAPETPAEYVAMIRDHDRGWQEAIFRPVGLVDGKIRRDNLTTGLNLTGPQTVTIDQAFAWFEEGRAARR